MASQQSLSRQTSAVASSAAADVIRHDQFTGHTHPGDTTTLMAARIFRNATGASTSATGSRALTDVFDTTERNDGMTVDLGTGKITVAATGWHTIVGKVQTSGAQTVLPEIWVNGSRKARGQQVGSAGSTVDFIVVASLYLTSGDYVQMGVNTPGSFGFVGSTAADTTFLSVVFDSAPMINGLLGHKATHYTGGADPLLPSDIGAAPKLTPTASKTGAYTAVAGELVVCNATSGGFTVTMPAAAAGDRVAVKKTDTSANAVTVSGTFVSGSASNPTLIMQDQVLLFLGTASGWVIMESANTGAALDARYQLLDADLTTIAGLTATTDNFMLATASAWASRTPAQAKTALALAKADVGLGSVDNTSDAGKPVSTAQQTALDLKQNRTKALANKTGDYTAVTTDDVLTVDSSGANRTITLYTAVGNTGRTVTIKKIAAANKVIIDGNSSETIDGQATETIDLNNGYRELVSDGTNWRIIGGRTGDPEIYTITYAATVTPDAAQGDLQRCTMTGAVALAVPTNGSEGKTLQLEFLASGAQRVITPNGSILLTNGITSPITVPSGKLWFGAVRYSGGSWYLIASQIQT